MIHHPIISGILVWSAIGLCFLCVVGLLVMRDPFERLHFSSPVTSVAITLITIAIWVEDPQWQARIKATLIAIILFLMNSILSHATARAVRLRDVEHWEVSRDEHIPLVSDHDEAPDGDGRERRNA